MALRINTNLSALFAHSNLKKTDSSLSKSLERLSTGLRINRAADDASGMSIANVMKAQALGIGQAIKNANDGINIVQIADGALDEAINIVNTIKTKAIQAAQDGQTLESRNTIQADIAKLMAELDDIAKTTSYNGMKLLSGNFSNKQFQVGAFTGETVDLNIGSAESAKIGHVVTGKLEATSTSGGIVQLSIYSNLKNVNVNINSVTLEYNNTSASSMGAVADAINRVSDATGITGEAVVQSTTDAAVAEGSTGADFAINGVTIGAVSVLANDSDGSLEKAINAKTSQHGMIASIDGAGYLTLASSDSRAIEVTGSTGGVLGASSLSTFGYVKVYQTNANDMKITNEAGSGSAVAFTSNLDLSGATTTTIDSTLKANSVIGSDSSFKAGSVIGFDMGDNQLNGDVTTTQDSVILAGSTISSGTDIAKDTILGGTTHVSGEVSTTGDSILKAGSVIGSGSTLKAGTVVSTDFYASGGQLITAGSVLSTDIVVTATTGFTLAADMTVESGSTFGSGSSFTAGSTVGGTIDVSGNLSVTEDMTLKSGSVISDGTTNSIKAGSTIGGDFSVSSAVITLTMDMTVKTGATLSSTTTLAAGSSVGGDVYLESAETTNADLTLAAGTIIATGSVLEHGTVLTNDIIVSGGDVIAAGTVLENDYTTSGTNVLENDMTIKKDSILAANSKLAANAAGATGTTLSDIEKYSLAEIDVTNQAGAQLGISIADAALKNLNTVRAGLGSIQNQLTSTIANLTVTQVNVTASESQIRDVDFAEESANFTRMQILMQAGTFAMAQANASSQNVLQLLQ